MAEPFYNFAFGFCDDAFASRHDVVGYGHLAEPFYNLAFGFCDDENVFCGYVKRFWLW